MLGGQLPTMNLSKLFELRPVVLSFSEAGQSKGIAAANKPRPLLPTSYCHMVNKDPARRNRVQSCFGTEDGKGYGSPSIMSVPLCKPQ